jgi:hypothetical protein
MRMRQCFNPEYGLFKSTEQALLFPNPQAVRG